MAKSKSLAKAVKAEVKDAAADASTGNVATRKAPAPQPSDLPTGTRRNLPPA